MIKKEIVDLIKQELKAEGLDPKDISVEASSFGDYSTSFALKLGKFKDYQTPEEIANFFLPNLSKNTLFKSANITRPGFINFEIDQKETAKRLAAVFDQEKNFGSSQINKNKKARIEFISANPTGPLHVGNARGGPLGDSLAKILEKSGFQVQKEYYDNNIGSQVDIFTDSLIGLIKNKLGAKSETKAENTYKGEYIEDLADQLIKALNLNSLDQIDPVFTDIKKQAIEILTNEILSDAKAIGVEFDEVFHESSLQASKTKEVIAELKDKGVTKEKDGALWFAPNDEYLEDRESVLVRSDGRPTYFADDIAYHKEKFSTNPDLIINVLGSNHHGHVPRLLAAMSVLGFDANKMQTVLYQYVRVKRGTEVVKMSKRAGNFITAKEVVEEVGSDAFRFLLLLQGANSHIDFDLELAKKQQNENPVYYVQYAHARMSSLLAKAGRLDLKSFKPELIVSPEEFNLTKKILELPDLVEEISQTFALQKLAHYSLDLAELFHSFYEKQRIIGEAESLFQSRLALVSAAQITLKNSLELLGVSAPEKM